MKFEKVSPLKFLFLIVMDNWKDYILPLFMAFYIPALAYLFGELNFYIIILSVILLISCVMGMADKDIQNSLHKIVKVQNDLFTATLAKTIVERAEQKHSFDKELEVSVDINLNDTKDVKIQ
jgi:hypothetical protein